MPPQQAGSGSLEVEGPVMGREPRCEVTIYWSDVDDAFIAEVPEHCSLIGYK